MAPGTAFSIRENSGAPEMCGIFSRSKRYGTRLRPPLMRDGAYEYLHSGIAQPLGRVCRRVRRLLMRRARCPLRRGRRPALDDRRRRHRARRRGLPHPPAQRLGGRPDRRGGLHPTHPGCDQHQCVLPLRVVEPAPLRGDLRACGRCGPLGLGDLPRDLLPLDHGLASGSAGQRRSTPPQLTLILCGITGPVSGKKSGVTTSRAGAHRVLHGEHESPRLLA
jgi:hypothetical protein